VNTDAQGNETTTTIEKKYYTVVKKGETGADEHSFDVIFADLTPISEVKDGSKIVVEYTSTLNEKAEIGATGNPNKMYLEYSNNPNDGTKVGVTPEDQVIVFTYKLVINKVDQAGNELPGAEFTLYKKDASITEETDGYEKIGESYYKIIKVKKWSSSDTTFSFEGLDDGDYILSETTTPDGYNTVANMAFTVTADHDGDSATPKLIDLTGDTTSGMVSYTDISKDLTKNLTAGSLTTQVTNRAGSTLPSTGGTGRVLLYVVGAILVVGVGVILVSKKRAQQ
jgi:LPXTG-motif cell wall-anchored protein